MPTMACLWTGGPTPASGWTPDSEGAVVPGAVSIEGQRELSGLEAGTSEDGTFGMASLRSLAARGQRSVGQVTSGAHQGLKEAIATMFIGAA